ncbi:MAG TPA: ABC transporter permease, partial [bacterium]|nr:ABC transporter permease [bacterium]
MKNKGSSMLETVRGFIHKELAQTLRDPRMRALLLLMPLVQLTVFGLALTSDVRNIKLAAHAEMRDPMMQEIIRDAKGGGWFRFVEGSVAEESDGFDLIRSGTAEVALFAPAGGLTKAFVRHEGKLQALIDSADLVRARSIENDVRAVTSRVAARYEELPRPLPVQFASRLLYNPEMVSAYYLVPGVICMILSIVTIMMTSMSIAREKEVGTFETLVSAPVSPLEILAGKTIPFILIGLVDLPLVIAIALLGFGVPMRGAWIELALAMVFFLITTVGIGTLISTIVRNQQ